MKRAHLHLLVDASMAAAGLVLVATGLLIWLVLPAHSRDATVWGWTRHDWGDLHAWIAVGLVSLLVLHLALNWNWVCSVVGKLCGQAGKPQSIVRRSVGIGALLLIAAALAGFLLLAVASRQNTSDGGRRHRFTTLAATASTPLPQAPPVDTRREP